MPTAQHTTPVAGPTLRTLRQCRRPLAMFGIGLLSLTLAACAFETKGGDGTRHYLILGAGLVSVNDQKSDAAVAVRTHSLGIAVSDIPGMRLAAGYASSKYVAVADGRKDLIIEIEDRPHGDLTVNVKGTEPHKENEK